MNAKQSVPLPGYEVIGKGDITLLCIPGWSEPAKPTYMPLVKCLMKLNTNYRFILVDLYDSGMSPCISNDHPNWGSEELIEGVINVIKTDNNNSSKYILVTHSHIGFIALEVAKLLGSTIDKLILVDWLLLGPPPAFWQILTSLSQESTWEEAMKLLLDSWLEDEADEEVIKHINENIRPYPKEAWNRAGREIAKMYKKYPIPLHAFEALSPEVIVLHIFSQPYDEEHYKKQWEYSLAKEWFNVAKVLGKGHFPMLSRTEDFADIINHFITLFS